MGITFKIDPASLPRDYVGMSRQTWFLPDFYVSRDRQLAIYEAEIRAALQGIVPDEKIRCFIFKEAPSLTCHVETNQGVYMRVGDAITQAINKWHEHVETLIAEAQEKNAWRPSGE